MENLTPKDLADRKAKTIRQITFIGLIINLILSGVKIAVGVLGSSSALVADGVHSLSDCTSDLAIIIGSKFWSQPPDHSHPYGHQRFETLITIGIGVAVGAVGVFILFDGFLALRNEDFSVPSKFTAIAAAASIITKEALYRWTIHKNRNINSPAIKANAWHHRSDAVSSLPVLITILVAAWHPEWVFVDAIGGLVVASFIMHASWEIVHPAILEIMDTGVPMDLYERIRQSIVETEGVCSVHELRTRYVGSEVYVDFHAVVNPELTVREGHKIAERLMTVLTETYPEVTDVLVHVDPHDDREEQGKLHIKF